MRFCISLTLERKHFDKLFIKRSLIKEHSGDDRTTHLYVFILKWIENFTQSFTEAYMMANSPLNINHKTVTERVNSASKLRRGSYMESVLFKGRSQSNDSSQTAPQINIVSPRNQGATHSSFKQQAILENKIRNSLLSPEIESKAILFICLLNLYKRGKLPPITNLEVIFLLLSKQEIEETLPNLQMKGKEPSIQTLLLL